MASSLELHGIVPISVYTAGAFISFRTLLKRSCELFVCPILIHRLVRLVTSQKYTQNWGSRVLILLEGNARTQQMWSLGQNGNRCDSVWPKSVTTCYKCFLIKNTYSCRNTSSYSYKKQRKQPNVHTHHIHNALRHDNDLDQ